MHRTQLMLTGLAIVMFALAACGPSAQEIAEMTAAAATDTPVPTETPIPTNTPLPTETPGVFEPVGNDLTTLLPAGNATTGEQLFQLQASDDGPGCASCHSLAEGVLIAYGGPSLYGIAGRAGTTREGYSAEEYLRESIVLPCEFLAEGEVFCPMPPNFGERLDAQNLADLITFLMEQTN